MPIEIPVIVWSASEDEPARLARVLAAAGAHVRRVGEDDALEATCAEAPSSFVILDGASARVHHACARLRALEHGAHAMIAIAGGDLAAFESDADVVWPAGVADTVVVRAVRRAAERAAATMVVRSVIDAAPDALFVVAEDGTIRVANAAVQAMLGHAPATLEGRSLYELVEHGDAHLVRELLAEAAHPRAVGAPSVVRARRHDGSLVEIELAARNMTHEPTLRGVVVNAREASERMSVGAALQESEMRFGAIFENLLDGLVQIDCASRRLVKANPAFCRITGYAADEISSLTLLDLFAPQDREALSDRLDVHFRSDRHVSESLSLRHKSGAPVYVDLGTTCMELSGVRFTLAVLRDVTARRETERTRELFLAIVAHELRTPVAVLQNSVHLLKGRSPPSPADHAAIMDVLAEEVQRLARLVADALDVGAIQAGTLKLRPHRVELAPLVTSVVARVAPQFGGHANVHVEDVDALVDPLRFEQIVTNLVDNAWRHGGERAIDVSLTASDGRARLEVLDRGPGLPVEVRSGVFERVLHPNERPTAGIGVGLWLVKRLTNRMEGTIDAAPGEGGRGVRFTVTFPLAKDASRSLSF